MALYEFFAQEKILAIIPQMTIALIILTVVFTVLANIYYIVTIFRGKTKPHIYSWLIWAIINIAAGLIQFQHGAGWGALTLGLGGFICIFVTIISLWYGEKHITKFDTITFIIALGIIPLWLWAKQDMLAMLLAISIDALSFLPTARKSFHKPREENLLPYFASGASFFMSIFLAKEKTLINILYPAVICGVNFGFIGYIYLRKVITKNNMTPLNAPINFIEETWMALNPFSAHQIDIWGVRFPTVEHAYQWSKFSDENIRKLIFEAKSPLIAWSIAQQYKSEVIPDFSKDIIMESLFRAKMEQHADVIETLKLSGSRDLLKNVLTDYYWGAGSDGSGQNKMGKLWMKLREEIIQSTTEKFQN